MNKLHSILRPRLPSSKTSPSAPWPSAPSLPLAITRGIKNSAKSLIFTTKAASIGVLTAGMLLFGVPVSAPLPAAQAQETLSGLPLPPPAVISRV